MILVDTSAWIEFLRDTGSAARDRVEKLMESKIAVCDPIRMDGLAGARDQRHLRNLPGLQIDSVAGSIPAMPEVSLRASTFPVHPHRRKRARTQSLKSGTGQAAVAGGPDVDIGAGHGAIETPPDVAEFDGFAAT